MSKLAKWLLGRQYRFKADFYYPGCGDGSEWRDYSGLFRWGGVIKKPKMVRVIAGPYEVYLTPFPFETGVRFNLKQAFKKGKEKPDFYVDDMSVTR